MAENDLFRLEAEQKAQQEQTQVSQQPERKVKISFEEY